MTLYGSAYGTDWDRLDLDEATERAYALGVAERLGEDNRGELRRIYNHVDAAYERNMIELAYVEGRREADAARSGGGGSDSVWSELVEEPDVSADPDDVTGGRDGLPENLDETSFLRKTTPDSTESLRRPDFLDK